MLGGIDRHTRLLCDELRQPRPRSDHEQQAVGEDAWLLRCQQAPKVDTGSKCQQGSADAMNSTKDEKKHTLLFSSCLPHSLYLPFFSLYILEVIQIRSGIAGRLTYPPPNLKEAKKKYKHEAENALHGAVSCRAVY